MLRKLKKAFIQTSIIIAFTGAFSFSIIYIENHPNIYGLIPLFITCFVLCLSICYYSQD